MYFSSAFESFSGYPLSDPHEKEKNNTIYSKLQKCTFLCMCMSKLSTCRFLKTVCLEKRKPLYIYTGHALLLAVDRSKEPRECACF